MDNMINCKVLMQNGESKIKALISFKIKFKSKLFQSTYMIRTQHLMMKNISILSLQLTNLIDYLTDLGLLKNLSQELIMYLEEVKFITTQI